MIKKILNIDLTKYIITGIFNTFLGIGLILFFSYEIGLNYLLSNILTYSVCLALVFIFYDNWVFNGSKNTTPKKIRLFLTIWLISFIMNLIVLFYTVKILAYPQYIGQGLGMLTYIIVSYSGNKLLTFKK